MSAIHWPEITYYARTTEVVTIINRNIADFGPVSSRETRAMSRLKSWDLAALLSIRRTLAAQKAAIARRQKSRVRQSAIRNKKSLEQWSRIVPPLCVIAIWRSLGFDPTAKELEWAQQHDAGSSLHQRPVLKASQEFENSLADWLRRHYPDSTFRTQEQLSGSAATPDILFDEPTPIIIPGQEPKLIRWMDAKNFFYLPVPFIARHLREQAEKYTQTFGPGAFVFHYGVELRTGFPRTIILTARFIKTDFTG